MRGPVVATLTTTLALLLSTTTALTKVGSLFNGQLSGVVARPKRSEAHVVTDCMTVSSDSGRFYVKGGSEGGQVCGVYLMAEPDQNIHLQFEIFDVPCEGGGLVAFVDGWELNGEVFPGASDHDKPFDERFDEFCGQSKVRKVLIASQNAALLQYRFPKASGGGSPHSFSFTVRHVFNPTPCNILSEGTTSIYTLRNYGRRVNCSVTMLSPATVQIIAMQVGGTPRLMLQHETGILHKCRKRGASDYLDVGGSTGLDPGAMVVGHQVCGLDSKPDPVMMLVECSMTTARLTSSGVTDNSVTLMLRTAHPDDFNDVEAENAVQCF